MAKRITATWHLESICARVPGLFWSRWCRKSDCSSPWLRLRRLLAGYNWPEPEPVTPTRGDQARKVKTGDLYPDLWLRVSSMFVQSLLIFIGAPMTVVNWDYYRSCNGPAIIQSWKTLLSRGTGQARGKTNIRSCFVIPHYYFNLSRAYDNRIHTSI